MNGIAAVFITGVILFAVARFAITESSREANGWLIFLGSVIALGLVA